MVLDVKEEMGEGGNQNISSFYLSGLSSALLQL